MLLLNAMRLVAMLEDHINNTLKTDKDNDKDDGNEDEVG